MSWDIVQQRSWYQYKRVWIGLGVAVCLIVLALPHLQNTYRRFEADCDQVNVPNGTLLDVKVNGTYVGSFRTLDQGGALVLTGKRAPNVSKGTTVSIDFHNGAPIVSGHY